ncbi:predicted protein [Nematostella vectensis]|uniref:MYCBP-associated protein n=1 Tax=Nematostella vectensis TaxID=45351 RepID=A7SXU7_NEMVE|nr:predicted protein [Nematostella vectensis]|eukprot:XP_001623570.1 predicted protein [Nematostella vectensis]
MSNKLSSKPSKRDRPKSTDKSKGKKQIAGTPEKAGSPVASAIAVQDEALSGSLNGKVISGDDVESLAINLDELKKTRPPKKPEVAKPSTKVVVRKARIKTDTGQSAGKSITVAKPAPLDFPLVSTPLTGSAGPVFDADGQVLTHSILGTWEDFYQEAMARGDIENLPPFSGSFVENTFTISDDRVFILLNVNASIHRQHAECYACLLQHAKEVRPFSDSPKKTKRSHPNHVWQTRINESNALNNWQQQMLQRKRQQNHLSALLQTSTDMLVMNQSEDYRKNQEQRHVIDRAIPSVDYGKGYRVGSEFWKQVEQIGNDETGITMTLTQTERGYPPPIEHISKPITIKNEMGIEWSSTHRKAAVHYPWQASGFLQERKEQLNSVMNEIDPHQPYMDELEVVGGRELPHQSKHAMSTVPEEEEPMAEQSPHLRDPLASYADVIPQPIFGPSLTIDGQTAQWTGSSTNGLGRVGVASRVTFEANTGERVVSLLHICNDGTTAIYFSWKRVPKANTLGTKLAGRTQRFYFDTNSGVILPGETLKFPFIFKSLNAGIFSENWELLTEPVLCGGGAIRVCLRGIAIEEDVYADARREIEKELAHREAIEAAARILQEILDGVRTPERSRSPVDAYITMHFQDEAVQSLKEIFVEVEPGAEWDLSVGGLQQSPTYRENLHSVSTTEAGQAIGKATEISGDEKLMIKLSTAIDTSDAHAIDIKYHNKRYTMNVTNVLRRRPNDKSSEVHKRALSLAQTTMSLTLTERQVRNTKSEVIHVARVMPQQLAIGIAVHQAIRSKDIINFLHGFGMSVEYNKILRVEAQIENNVLQRMQQNGGTYLSPDIILGRRVFFAADNVDFAGDTPDGKRNLHGTAMAIYQKTHPEDVTPELSSAIPVNSEDNSLLQETQSDPPETRLSVMGQDDASNDDVDYIHSSAIPFWSGYNSLIHETQPVTRIGSPPLIAAPAHEWSTLLTVLMQAQGITTNVMGPGQKTVISLDMGLYQPAKKLQMARNDLNDIILRPAFIAKQDAAMVKQIGECAKQLEDACLSGSMVEVRNADKKMEDKVKSLDVFLNYMRMVMEMLLFVRAVRTGDWKLHLTSLELLTKYFFAHDRLNYARMVPLYLPEMQMLEATDPAIYQEFMEGNWIVNKNPNVSFCAVGADNALEQINRSMKVSGGLVGITLNPTAQATRVKRQGGEVPIHYRITPSTLIAKLTMKKLLAHADTKKELAEFRKPSNMPHRMGRGLPMRYPDLCANTLFITGSFASKGKPKCWKVFCEASEEVLAAISNLRTSNYPSVQSQLAVEKLVCQIFLPQTEIVSVKALRWWLFKKKQERSERLPPTSAALKQAILRSHYQLLRIMVVEDDDTRDSLLQRLNQAIVSLSFPPPTPMKQAMYTATLQVLCEMVDNIVGQAVMIRSILGLPQRDMVEDISQEEVEKRTRKPTIQEPKPDSKKSERKDKKGKDKGADHERPTSTQRSKLSAKKSGRGTATPSSQPKSALSEAADRALTPASGDGLPVEKVDPVIEAKYREKLFIQAYGTIVETFTKLDMVLGDIRALETSEASE